MEKNHLQESPEFMPVFFFPFQKSIYFLLIVFRFLFRQRSEKSSPSLKHTLRTKKSVKPKRSLSETFFLLDKSFRQSFSSFFIPKTLHYSFFGSFLLTLWMSFVFTSCVLPTPFPSPAEVHHQRSQAEREGRNRRRDRSQDTINDKPCSENRECPDICEKIFDHRTERDECEDRSVSEVKEFERIYNFFKGTDAEGELVNSDAEYFGNLSRIREEDLEDFVNISENLVNLVGDIPSTPSTRKPTFRNWIADNPPVAEILKDKKDESFSGFKEIFGSTSDNVIDALFNTGYIEEPGGNNKNPAQVAVGAGNRDLIQWIHDYLGRETTCNPLGPRDILKKSEDELNERNEIQGIWCPS